MRTAEIAIVGGGALGLCLAAELARRGARPLVFDPPGPPSASAVAGGMLAPAFEAALDAAPPEPARLGRRARDLWPELADRVGVTLHRAGAEWRGPEPARLAERMRAAGFAASLEGGRLHTPDDWWLEPEAALAALAAAPGVTLAPERVLAARREAGGWRLETESGPCAAGELVLACGTAAAPDGVGWRPPVRPVKGQIARVRGWRPPWVLRGPGAYVVPASGGAVVGATMEPDRRDLEVEPAVIDSLLARATSMAPELVGAVVVSARAGLRGESPDGLPLAGRVGPGLFAALAPRRNGWLIAPLVAEVAADAIEGRGPDPLAAAMDPARFDAPSA